MICRPAQQRIVLCFDIGGTHLRGAVYDSFADKFIAQCVYETPNYILQPESNAEYILDRVIQECADLGKKLLAGLQPDTLVVGYPGPVTNQGVALRSPTILGSDLDRPFDVGSALRKFYPGVDVHVLNDLTCSGLFFVEQGWRDFCIITVGSGIGNKVFINGEPIVGQKGRGGEIGHLKACGIDGLPFRFCWTEIGNVSSGRGTFRLAIAWATARPNDFDESSMKIEDFRPPANDMGACLVQAFRKKDELAIKIVTAACYPLAFAIASIHQAIGTEMFMIVGGFSKALGNHYREILVSTVSDMTWDLGQNWDSMIQLGKTDEEEGLLGAVRYALRYPAKKYR